MKVGDKIYSTKTFEDLPIGSVIEYYAQHGHYFYSKTEDSKLYGSTECQSFSVMIFSTSGGYTIKYLPEQSLKIVVGAEVEDTDLDKIPVGSIYRNFNGCQYFRLENGTRIGKNLIIDFEGHTGGPYTILYAPEEK